MESPATQNTADGQDTDRRNGPLPEVEASESILTGALQLLPLNVNAFPS